MHTFIGKNVPRSLGVFFLFALQFSESRQFADNLMPFHFFQSADCYHFTCVCIIIVTAAVRSKAVFLLLLTFCLLLLPLWESEIVLCFVVCYFMSVLVLQSS